MRYQNHRVALFETIIISVASSFCGAKLGQCLPTCSCHALLSLNDVVVPQVAEYVLSEDQLLRRGSFLYYRQSIKPSRGLSQRAPLLSRAASKS
eukprot:6199261-Pleurochrysis_carterae.AAC.1